MSKATPIFLPGLLCNSWLFKHQRGKMSCCAMVADNLSYQKVKDMAYSALAMADCKIVPIGLSMGGYIAVKWYGSLQSAWLAWYY